MEADRAPTWWSVGVLIRVSINWYSRWALTPSNTGARVHVLSTCSCDMRGVASEKVEPFGVWMWSDFIYPLPSRHAPRPNWHFPTGCVLFVVAASRCAALSCILLCCVGCVVLCYIMQHLMLRSSRGGAVQIVHDDWWLISGERWCLMTQNWWFSNAFPFCGFETLLYLF